MLGIEENLKIWEFEDLKMERGSKICVRLSNVYIIAVLFLLFGANQSNACSCGRSKIKKGQNSSKIIFTGKLISSDIIITKDTIGLVSYEDYWIVKYQRINFNFETYEILKGKVETKNITITTTGGGADCGSNFEIGKEYLVYSYESKNKLHFNLSHQEVEPFLTTSLCTRTKEIRNKNGLEILRLRMLRD